MKKELELKEIIAQFFPSPPPSIIRPFGNGHINDTFKFHIGDPPFLLQRINHQIFQQPALLMENIELVSKHLIEKKFQQKVLHPITTKKGKLFYSDSKGNYWRVYPFFKNSISYDQVDDEWQAYEAAKAFGGFSKALMDLKISKLHTTIPDFHNGIKRLKDFKKAIQNAKAERQKTAIQEIDSILKHKNIFYKIHSLDLPLRLTHNDTKINNFLFSKNQQKAIAIVDWDTIMPGTILSDFGDMVRTFCPAADENEADLKKVIFRNNILEALKEGYLSEMDQHLSPIENENLMEGAKWIILMQAMRFIADYLNGDIYYKTAYETHNLVRGRNQLKVYEAVRSF